MSQASGKRGLLSHRIVSTELGSLYKMMRSIVFERRCSLLRRFSLSLRAADFGLCLLFFPFSALVVSSSGLSVVRVSLVCSTDFTLDTLFAFLFRADSMRWSCSRSHAVGLLANVFSFKPCGVPKSLPSFQSGNLSGCKCCKCCKCCKLWHTLMEI